MYYEFDHKCTKWSKMFIITYDFLGQLTWKNVINIFFEHFQREQEKDIR